MDNCNSSDYNSSDKKRRFQQRRLQMLIFIRDGIERRLAATNASIEKLNEQISRDLTEEVT
tara:strand:- start:311 stop:493 length:183 start_codon:yes stop_codon:yes gene_type:complete